MDGYSSGVLRLLETSASEQRVYVRCVKQSIYENGKSDPNQLTNPSQRGLGPDWACLPYATERHTKSCIVRTRKVNVLEDMRTSQ